MYITLSDLLQFGMFTIAFAGLLYKVWHKK